MIFGALALVLLAAYAVELTLTPILLVWGASVGVFIVYGLDKSGAAVGGSRVSESVLKTLALLAPAGAVAGRLVFNHKTRKRDFSFTLGAGLTLHFVALLLFS